MKIYLRWIGFLPAAVVAFFLVQFINALIPFIPSVLVQWWNSWASALMFIIVGCYVAPKYKFVIGIFLAIAVCGSVVFTFIIRSDMPLWDIIVCDIFSLLGAFAGGAGAKAFEDQEKD